MLIFTIVTTIVFTYAVITLMSQADREVAEGNAYCNTFTMLKAAQFGCDHGVAMSLFKSTEGGLSIAIATHSAKAKVYREYGYIEVVLTEGS